MTELESIPSPRVGQVHELTRIIAKALEALQQHARHMRRDEAASIVSQIEGLEEQFDATATIAGRRAEALEREADAARDPIRCIRCRTPLRDDPSGNPFRCATCQRKAVWG